MSLALASSTQATYSSGVKRFLNFCMEQGVQSLAADKLTLVYFSVALSRSLTTPTIKVYLSAVGSFHCHQGFKDPTHHNPQLTMVLRGKQRANIDRRSHPRQPITRAILHSLAPSPTFSQATQAGQTYANSRIFVGVFWLLASK